MSAHRDPIWFKPREGFTSACIDYFGMSFDGGPVQRPEPLTPPKSAPGRPAKNVIETMSEAAMRHRNNGAAARNNTVFSRNALRRSDRRLVG
jgi:hypothetical protein